MTLTRYNTQLPRFFDDFFTKEMDGFSTQTARRNSLPAVNIKEDENGFQLEVAAPGRNKEDFQVKFDQGVLTISAQPNDEQENKQSKYLKHEFRPGNFQHSFRVEEKEVNGDNIVAKYENGVLYLTLPKREEAKPKPARQIEVA